MLAFIQRIGTWELVIISGIALLIFGGKLPEVGRSFGKSISEFQQGLKDIDNNLDKAGQKSLEESCARSKSERTDKT
jgi:sec-independent protein translocase protein TatA